MTASATATKKQANKQTQERKITTIEDMIAEHDKASSQESRFPKRKTRPHARVRRNNRDEQAARLDEQAASEAVEELVQQAQEPIPEKETSEMKTEEKQAPLYAESFLKENMFCQMPDNSWKNIGRNALVDLKVLKPKIDYGFHGWDFLAVPGRRTASHLYMMIELFMMHVAALSEGIAVIRDNNRSTIRLEVKKGEDTITFRASVEGNKLVCQVMGNVEQVLADGESMGVYDTATGHMLHSIGHDKFLRHIGALTHAFMAK